MIHVDQKLLIGVLILIALSSCTGSQVSPAAQTQSAASGLAAANALLTSTYGARPPSVHTSAPTPLPFGSGVLPYPYTGTPPVVPVTGATATAFSVCNHPMTVLTPGPKAQVRINNKTGVPITFTMGLSERNFLGDCGHISKTGIPPEKSTIISVPWSNPPPTGPCYWASAVIPGRKHQTTTVSGYGFCLVNSKTWIINVNNQAIRLVGR